MSLMAILIEPILTESVNMTKLLKMIIIHDLVEAEARDVPVPEILKNPGLKKQKEVDERKAIENLRLALHDTNGQEIYDLWNEFEAKSSYEAKVANAMDKLEVQLQHNHADFSTWEEIEYELSYLITKHTDFDPVIDELKELIVEGAEKKMLNAGIDVEEIKKKAIERRKSV